MNLRRLSPFPKRSARARAVAVTVSAAMVAALGYTAIPATQANATEAA